MINYAKATLERLLDMTSKEQKAVYTFMELLKSWDRGKGEEEATNPTPAPSVYEQNDTMRLLGKQNILRYVDNEEARTGLRNIAQARGIDFSGKNFDVLLDTFMYGRIIGIKEERAKKKSHQPNDQVRKAAF